MKPCKACNAKGVVSWASRHAADKDGRFSMSGDVMGDARISVCGQCHGKGFITTTPQRSET